jgi:hypothetical protein
MPGASERTRPIKNVNANWVAGEEGSDGRFALQLITVDDHTYSLTPGPAAMAALIALTQAGTVLAWDPEDDTLIAANLVGTMPWTEQSDPQP